MRYRHTCQEGDADFFMINLAERFHIREGRQCRPPKSTIGNLIPDAYATKSAMSS